MSRRSAKPYLCQALDDLARQLVRGPAASRHRQVFAAESLHDQLKPREVYPADYLSFGITGHRLPSTTQGTELLVGEAVLADLRRMIDSLSRSVFIGPDEADGVHLAEALTHELNVSSKTLIRWRDRGLRWRWVRAGDTQRQVIAYPRRAVEHFCAASHTRRQRGGVS